MGLVSVPVFSDVHQCVPSSSPCVVYPLGCERSPQHSQLNTADTSPPVRSETQKSKHG